MSKIYNKYLELKEKDSSKYYLFESGIFYLFIADDAVKINNLLNLKLTHLNEEVLKCGFPINSVEKYKRLFDEKNLNVEFISKNSKSDDPNFYKEIINRIKSIDINSITPLEALNELNKIKEKL